MRNVWAFAGFLVLLALGAIVLEALKRRGFDPVGAGARLLSPEPSIVAESGQ